MAKEKKRPLKVFLCHASGDKPPVRDLYKRLKSEGVDAWLDQERLLPGQDWRLEIPKAVQEADVVVICLSKKSITKEGYVQKEIKFALDIAEEKPEGTIFLIPARLEDCIVPERLNRWQWVDLYEENGCVQLLRSLRLRAESVGAAVEPVAYEDSDKEIQRRLDQLYTEGLAAFYTEDWDRACQRFQSILSERPSHKSASEKLAEAERQRNLSRLYAQATEAFRNEDWGSAIQTLEELSQKSVDYRDTVGLLRNARKQKQLKELFAEAGRLHAAGQWEAVVKVFEQISSIDPDYADAERLLPSAQKEVAELKRLAGLNTQYSQALREMDAGNWIEARRLLESVHKSQTGFLETEKLLKKVEEEIAREEEKRRQNDQINTLYEQAHGLLRSKKWRNALEKMEEIRKLDEHFPDADGIAAEAQKALACEEQEAERQNQLAALYAEAVKLLKEEKYQEALDKWGEVRAIDPRYPDRQRVHNAARKALTRQAKPVATKPRFSMPKSLWIGLGSILAIATLIFAINRFGKGENKASLVPTTAPTGVVVENTALPVPTTTNMPQKTSTPRPTTPVQTASGYSDLTMYDDFSNSAYDGSYNKSLWGIYSSSNKYVVNQNDGQLSIKVSDKSGVDLNRKGSYKLNEPFFFEARLFLDPKTTDRGTHFYIEVNTADGGSNCGIFRTGDYAQQITCWGEHYGKKSETKLGLDGILPGWHILRFEIDPSTMIISYVVDSRHVAYFDPKEIIPDHFTEFKQSNFNFTIGLNNFGPSKAPVGYIDYVRMGAIEDDSTVYDNFDDINFDGKFDSSKWAYRDHDPDGRLHQEDGALVFEQSGTESRWQFLLATKLDFYPVAPAYFESALKLDRSAEGGDVQLGFNSNYGTALCGIETNRAYCWCHSGDNHLFDEGITVRSNSWQFYRIEVIPSEAKFTFYINGQNIGACSLPAPAGTLESTAIFDVGGWMHTKKVKGYVDYIHIGPLK